MRGALSRRAALTGDAKISHPKLPIWQMAAVAAILLLPPAQAKAQFEWLFGRPEPARPPAAQPGPAARPAKPKPHKPKEAKKSEPTAAAPAAQAEEPPPPFDPDLLRLAEILGALAYLDDLCAVKPEGDWRGKMQALMEAEAKSKARKEKFAGSYNRGFRDYGRSYHICTQNAQAAIGQFLAEGEKIAHEVVARYGGS